ncbi:MAG: Gfo/Idh/MocA family oxidoreductase [Chloroflexi bacterium]|jgi:predicted dehydrogenase|nr:Gfo/Idh/MocA family oxidoreductase [Chloroflexota bacterium]
MTAPLKAAVIGVGSMGRHHARVYTQISQTTLVGVADADAATAERIGAQYSVPTYTDYEALLTEEKPDIVTVAVPTRYHHDVATHAMEAGADLLIEKPIAATVAEGQALIDRANALGRNLMVGHILRFSPVIQALKQHITQGDLGKIFQVACRRVGPFPVRIQDVGVVVDLAPHDLDVMRFITGAEPIRLFAEIEQQVHTDHEDLVSALIRFDNGITGTLEINWLTPRKVREVTILGECGMFLADDLTQDLFFYENAAASELEWNHLSILRGVSEGKMIRYPIQRGEPLRAELEAFANAVLAGDPMPVTGKDGLSALQLALSLVKSGNAGEIISV